PCRQGVAQRLQFRRGIARRSLDTEVDPCSAREELVISIVQPAVLGPALERRFCPTRTVQLKGDQAAQQGVGRRPSLVFRQPLSAFLQEGEAVEDRRQVLVKLFGVAEDSRTQYLVGNPLVYKDRHLERPLHAGRFHFELDRQRPLARDLSFLPGDLLGVL